MEKVELILPKMGESVAEATLIKWLKNEGEEINEDEFIVEIATDKVDSEVPSTHSGILTKKLFKEEDVIKVGEPFAIIETKSSENKQIENTIDEIKQSITYNDTKKYLGDDQKNDSPTKNSTRFYSPLVKNIAKQENISLKELENIDGSGKDGRITKTDILDYVNNNKTTIKIQEEKNSFNKETPKRDESNLFETSINNDSKKNEEIIEMGRVRKIIAKHMIDSKATSPHVTSFVEADVSDIVKQRLEIKEDFFKQYGENITFTPIFLKAIIETIKEFPMINVSVQGDKIIKKNYINIGMATALKNGNLIVPVIKNADMLNLLGLTKSVNSLVKKARNNSLSSEEISNGTYTVTNVGSFGNLMGTPIINQPQVAILAIGAIQKKVSVIETRHGDVIGIRHKMFLSHSYDHRVIDGALGGMFINKVAEKLAEINLKTEL